MAQKSIGKIVLFVAVVLVFFVPPFAKFQELRNKNIKLETDIAKLKSDIRRLEQDKKKLETDIGFIEATAREKIGVVRKGEIVLKNVTTVKKKE